MSKKIGFKATMISILLIVPLMLGLASIGYAQEPPAGSKITGKAIDAVLSAVEINLTIEGAGVDDGCPVVVQTIVGTCNNIPFVIGPLINNPITPDNIAGILEEQVEGILLANSGPPGCYSEFGGDDLVITRVSSFSNAGEAIGAVVSLRKVE